MSINSLDNGKRAESREALLEQVRQAVAGLRFGSVELIIHEGRVVQIERRERLRLERQSDADH